MRFVIITFILSVFSILTLNAQSRTRQANEGSRTPSGTTRTPTSTTRTPTSSTRTPTSTTSAPSRTEMNVAPVANGDGDVFTVVEVMPEFPGGDAGLRGYLGSITYPDDALDNNWEGKVYLNFVIEKDGTISDVVVTRSSGYKVLDDAASFHIATMPPWKPGTQSGQPVRVKYTLPMTFKL